MLSPQRSKRIVNFIKRFVVKNNIQEVKASILSFPHKQDLLHKLNTANDCTIAYVIADKHNIDNEKILEDKNLCYNYLFSFLVKNTIKYANDDVSILLDNHTTKVKSINSLKDYIKIKAYFEWGFTHKLNISYVDSKNSKVIQAADVVANAIYAKYVYGKEHLYKMLTINESIKFPFAKFGK
jgi:hypothetical protein